MRAASRGRRTVQWLHGALAVGVALSTLVATAPLRGAYAEPIEQVRGPGPGTGGAQTGGGAQAPGVGGVPVPSGQTATGRQSDQICRQPAAPLTRNYVDVTNGFAIQYPQNWFWRPRSDGLTGTRSDTIWFSPVVEAGTLPNCIMVVRTAVHYFLADTSLEEMREATAMVDFASLLTRALQARIATGPTPVPALAAGASPIVPLSIPAARLPTFWGDIFTRSLWGAERLALPTGQQYYREIGRGAIRDLLRQEYPGSIVRYVIALSPRAMLEVVGEATVPEYEAQYGRLFEQMVLSLRLADEVSPNPGPIGTTVTPERCQAMILLDSPTRRRHDRDDRTDPQPFLERSAVSQRLEVTGAAALIDPEDPDAPCDGEISRMAIFLDPPIADDDRAVQNISVYGVPYSTRGVSFESEGFYLRWDLPSDLYGQRTVYFAAQLPDGNWSWVTRQINIAPPLSVAVQVSPPEAQVGERIGVTMRVYNNTDSPMVDVRPLLNPNQGPGTVLLRSGPSYVPNGCALDAPVTDRPQVATQDVTGLTEAIRAGDAVPVRLEAVNAAGGRGRANCALFVWEFTALRSGSVSFSGTAEGRLVGSWVPRPEESAASRPVHLLSRGEAAPDPQPLSQEGPGGGTVTAPPVTAADFQVSPVELQLAQPVAVLAAPDFDVAPRFEVWTLVRNASDSRVYNVRALIEPRGTEVRALPSPLLPEGVPGLEALQQRRTEIAFLRGAGNACPSVPLAPGRLSLEQRQGIQPGDTVPFMLEGQCVAFIRAFELVDPAADQPFTVEARVSASTQHSGSQDPTGGARSVPYPELTAQTGPYTPSLLLEQPGLPRRLNCVLPGAGLEPVLNPAGAALNAACGSVAAAAASPQGGAGAPGGAGGGAGGAPGTAGSTVGGATGIPGQPVPGQVPGTGYGPGGAGPGVPGIPGVGGPPLPSPGSPAGGVLGPAVPSGALGIPGGVQVAGAPPGPAGAPAASPLDVRVRSYPVGSPDARVFQPTDRIRIEMDVTNVGDEPLFNVRPSNLAINGQFPTDLYNNPLAGPAGAGGAQANIIASAAAQAAGAVAARPNATQQQIQDAAIRAAQGAQVAQNTVLNTSQCLIQPPPPGGVLNQIRQVTGPSPLATRLRPGEKVTFTWEFYVQEFREQQPTIVFQGFAQADTPDGTITSPAVPSDPLERLVRCVFVQLAAEPAVVPSGGIIDVTMHAQNNTAFYSGSQFGGTGLTYRDTYPLPLSAVVIGTDLVNLQVLSGPSNPVTGAGIDLGPNQVIDFRWRYQVSGSGCFNLRGVLGASLRGASFYSNTAQSNLVCVQGPPTPSTP